MQNRESKLEAYLKKKVEGIGGVTFKWTPAGISGVPDQIVMFKNKVWFVEMKNSDGRLGSSQKNTLPLISKHHDVNVVYGYEQVDVLIEEMLTWTGSVPSLRFYPETKRKQLRNKNVLS